jgi:hypothetical protein
MTPSLPSFIKLGLYGELQSAIVSQYSGYLTLSSLRYASGSCRSSIDDLLEVSGFRLKPARFAQRSGYLNRVIGIGVGGFRENWLVSSQVILSERLYKIILNANISPSISFAGLFIISRLGIPRLTRQRYFVPYSTANDALPMDSYYPDIGTRAHSYFSIRTMISRDFAWDCFAIGSTFGFSEGLATALLAEDGSLSFDPLLLSAVNETGAE